MRLNKSTKIIGCGIILVPYEAKHVEKYHKWMENPELQELTASEPLQLDEEYSMQRSWREDEDKCTFLVASKEIYKQSGDEILALIGDINLFLSTDTETNEKVAEVSVMIAECDARGKGFGKEAVLLMLKYGLEKLGIQRYCAKIGIDNTKSLRMFEKIEFKETCRSEIFREVSLECNVTEKWSNWLDKQVQLLCEDYC